MNAKLGVFLASIIIIGLIILPSVNASILSLNPTDNSNNNDYKLVSIGAMKPGYEIVANVKNDHEHCNITAEICIDHHWPHWDERDYSYDPKQIKPHEEFTLNKTTIYYLDYALLIIAECTSSIPINKQTDVGVEYTIRVYNEKDQLIYDSEDPSIKPPNEDNNTLCGSIMILPLLLIIMIILFSIYSRKRKNSFFRK